MIKNYDTKSIQANLAHPTDGRIISVVLMTI